MENLKITIVQPDIIWEDAEANLRRYSEMLENIEQTDVIVLPEMFATGFSMQSKNLKEKMDGLSVNWMKKLAKEKNASVAGSLIIEDNGNLYNRAIWAFPDAKTQHYDKRHLFSMAEENQHYSAGREKLIVEFRGWKFCPLICYDLRFPVWSRNVENYDVLIYMANWPAPRQHVWENLLIARAIENQSYCIGVNRVGNDGAGVNYVGGSAIVSPKGFADFEGENETIKTVEISYSELHQFRKSFPILNDRDSFQIQ